jgi:3'(2'), 5'-bisphosphate nucleotidase
MLEENLLIALEAAINAGSEIMKIYESDNFEIEVKEDASPLTKADKTAHQIISKHLSKTGLPILSEEGKHIPFENRNSDIILPDGFSELLEKSEIIKKLGYSDPRITH